jgi:hypothetical protein
MKIHLHIERLVLDGVPLQRTQSGRLRAAVEQELARLLKSGGLARELRSGVAVPAVRGGNLRLQKSTNARMLGRDIATALHHAIGNSSRVGKKR